MRRRSLLCALPPSLLARHTHAQSKTLDLACYSSQTLGGQAAHLFADKVTEVSSGAVAVAVEVLPLTMPFPMISKASALAAYYAPGFADFESVFELSALPMLAATFDEAQALDRIARPYYGAALARYGQILLATHPWRPAARWSTFRIRSSADLKGAEFSLGHTSYSGRAATWENPFLRLGVRKVSPFDAELLLTNGYLSNLTFTQQFAAIMEIFFAVQLSFLTVSQAIFDSLSESQRQVLVVAGRDTEHALWQSIREFVARDQQEIAARGVLVAAEPPGDLVADLRKAAEPDIQRWADSLGADGASILIEHRRTIGRL
ncbi:MAG TPA: hypothetical protein VLA02_01600 [Reyranella sp.]|nr:hypothetical protein [Reyranella sp.]